MSILEPLPAGSSIRAEIRRGIRLGLIVALFLGAVAAIRLVAVSDRAQAGEALRLWSISLLFYLGAAVLGGTVFGLLRPTRDRYWGRLLTAYLILFLVYGAGAVVLLPFLVEKPVPTRSLLIVMALACVVLAPIYELLTQRLGRRNRYG